MTANPLNIERLRYAYWTEATDPETGGAMPGLGAHWFARFVDPAVLRALRLHRPADARGGRAERVTVQLYTDDTLHGQTVFDGSLDWRGDTCELDLGDQPAALGASIRCHWKSPVKVDFSEHHPRLWTVGFDIFHDLKWLGEVAPDHPTPQPPVAPALQVGRIAPRAGGELHAESDGMFATFTSDHLRVAFSLKRPRMEHLCFDPFGQGDVHDNLLAGLGPIHGSGPALRSLWAPVLPMHFGGAVEVIDNRVIYRDLHVDDTLRLDAEWTIEPRAMRLQLRQHVARSRTYLEAAAWRMVFDRQQTPSLATLAKPLRGHHRNGRVEPRGGWHASGRGTLTFASDDADVAMQVENYGYYSRIVQGEIQLGVTPQPFGPVTLREGDNEGAMTFTVDHVKPRLRSGAAGHRGLHRAWGSVFGFRPEHGGMSNSSFSINCANCQYLPADMAAYTQHDAPLPKMTDLVRYTVGLALRGGPGYAVQFQQALDSAPSLIAAAASGHRADPDDAWLADLWPDLRAAAEAMLNQFDETGMYTSYFRAGLSHSGERSCNAWDNFHFGHHDGYSGALAYRALHCAAALARGQGDDALAQTCLDTAARQKAAYAADLLNPDTGFIAGWRDREGNLHDYAIVFINTMAICFGLVDDAQARDILGRIEALRVQRGITDFRYGMATQLEPIPPYESEGRPPKRGRPYRLDGLDTFGVNTNGGLTPGMASFYVLALSKHGCADVADKVCDDILESYDRRVFDGYFTGVEMHTFDGSPSGYEGTLTHGFHILHAIGIHKGWIDPFDPLWWPGIPSKR